jgi:predicted Fe-Mo cluster-binding NifX family protein
MKIGITVEEPNPDAKVGQRFGLSEYLMIVDSETLSIKMVPCEEENTGRQSGIQMVILAISHNVKMVITGYISPTAEKYLIENGIKVVSGFRGTASAALETVYSDDFYLDISCKDEGRKAVQRKIFPALKKSLKQVAVLLPVMTGVILLIGLFNAFLTRDIISGVFTGKALPDSFLGTCLGSLLAGNPINSYLIGKELLERGVSLFGVTAFMTAWVSVGLVQVPAEIVALGKRFALTRNVLSFLLSIVISLLTVGLFYLIGG